MKKLLFAGYILAASNAIAQPEGRVFTITNQTYTDLSSPTIVTTPGWDDFNAVIPLGFNFTALGKTNDTVYLDSLFSYGMDLSLDLYNKGATTVIGTLEDYFDRDTALTGKSFIGYKIEGAAGNRIAKIQGKNLGFLSEAAGLGTLNDSTNYQIWLYEGTNNVEVRWGRSSVVSDYEDIFVFGLPFFAFGKDVDVNNTTTPFDHLYYVSNTAPPKVDSFNVQQFATLTTPIGFSPYPANGTVFKFAKPTTGINGTQLNSYTSVYPTLFSNELTIAITDNTFEGDAVLIDINGKMVARQKIADGKNIIATANLTAGNYVLNIRGKNESVFYKITKQ